MKRIRRVMALLIAVILVIGLAACGSQRAPASSAGNSPDAPAPAAPENPADSGEGTETGASQTVDAEEPGEVTTIRLQIITYGEEMSDLAEVAAAVNEFSGPAVGVNIEIVPTFIGEQATAAALMIAGGTDVCDLMAVGRVLSFGNAASTNMLMPLDDLVVEYGQDLLALFGDQIDGGYYGGKLYAIPANPYPAMNHAIVFKTSLAEEFGIDYGEGPITIDEMVAQWDKLPEGVYAWSMGSAQDSQFHYFYDMTTYGGKNYNYGITLHPESSTEVINAYASDEYREYVTMLRGWVEDGYMDPNSLTSGLEVNELMQANTVFCTVTQSYPAQVTIWNNTLQEPSTLVDIDGPTISTSAIQEMMWGIPCNSEHPEAAMKFLNYLYSDAGAEIANLLENGLEGKQWVATDSERIIARPEGFNPMNAGYAKDFMYFGNTLHVKQYQPLTEDFYDALASFNENAVMAKGMGYTFDASAFDAEITAVSNVIQRYGPALECGQVDDIDAYLDEFLSALDAAGYNDIIKANQEQFDAFLEAQG